MQWYFNLVFQATLRRARYGLLNFKNINILNNQVLFYFSNSDFTNTIIVIQKNKTKHLINYLQVENFAYF